MLRAPLLLCLTACSLPGEPAGWIDGERYPVAQSWVYAEDNDNTRWSAMLESARPYPREFSDDLRQAWVEFGGVRQAVTGIGGSPAGTYFHLQTDRAGALNWAKALGVPAGARSDPGLDLRGAITLLRNPAPLGEPVLARFVLTNAGPAPVAFTSRLGVVGPARDEDFAVAITRGGVLVPAMAAPPDLGGLRRIVELAPGQSVDFELDLSAWANCDAPGRYQARVRYRLVAEPPGSFRSPAYAKAHLLWDAEVAAEGEWTIE